MTPEEGLPMTTPTTSVSTAHAAPLDVSTSERASLLDRPVNTNRGHHHHHRGCYVAAVVAGALALGSVAGVTRHRSSSVDLAALGATGASESDEYAAILGGALKWEDVFGNVSLEDRKALVARDLGGRTEGRGLPTFLHIPKNGGTTIETVLGKLGIDAGYCHLSSVQGAPRPYELRQRFDGFEKWHTPPANRVPDSWAIVRDPYRRAGSEFLWSTHLNNKELFYSLKPGYSVKNCEALQEYVQGNIAGMIDNPARKCYDENGYTMEGMATCDATLGGGMGGGIGAGSHWIPQSVMLAATEKVFRFETCFDVEDGECEDARTGQTIDNIIRFLRKRYHPAITLSETPKEWVADDVEKPDFKSCWKGFDPAILNAFNDVYKYDIERFGYKVINSSPGASGSSFSHQQESHGETYRDITNARGYELEQYSGPGCF